MQKVSQQFQLMRSSRYTSTSVSKCGECLLACPEELDIPEAMEYAAKGSYEYLEALHDLCIGCRRCEQVCKKEIPILNVIEKAAQKAISEEKGLVRAGRGQVSDAEIRKEGLNLVMGTTPGIIAIIGCPNYPSGTKDVYHIAEEFLKRNYLLAVSGCSAMDIGMYKDEEGKTLYERYPGTFAGGGLLNTGSCVSNAHITGAAEKVAGIFAGGPWQETLQKLQTTLSTVLVHADLPGVHTPRRQLQSVPDVISMVSRQCSARTVPSTGEP